MAKRKGKKIDLWFPATDTRLQELMREYEVDDLQAIVIQQHIDDGWKGDRLKWLVKEIKRGKVLIMTYEHTKPTTEEERFEQELRLKRAYDIIIQATLNSYTWKEYLAEKKKRNDALNAKEE